MNFSIYFLNYSNVQLVQALRIFAPIRWGSLDATENFKLKIFFFCDIGDKKYSLNPHFLRSFFFQNTLLEIKKQRKRFRWLKPLENKLLKFQSCTVAKFIKLWLRFKTDSNKLHFVIVSVPPSPPLYRNSLSIPAENNFLLFWIFQWKNIF